MCRPPARAQGIADPVSRLQVETLDSNCAEFGVNEFKMSDVRQGIVHVIGPEQGATLPGMTVVCGDSHTSTHGAFAALAFGIGTSEVEHVMATQCLLMKKSRAMQVVVDGALGRGVTAKDIALAVIGKIGTAGGTGYAIEFAGSTIRGLSMEGRMTLCNMAIEAGARAGMVAADDTTIDYLKGRPFAPQGELWDKAVAYWRTLHSDEGAQFDQVVKLDAAQIKPQVTWGTSPEMVVAVDGRVPDPASDQRCGQARCRRARAEVHGPESEHADRGDQHRQGVHRLLHQCAHRGYARGCGDRARQTHRGECETGDGGAGFRTGETAGRTGRSGQDIHRGRF